MPARKRKPTKPSSRKPPRRRSENPAPRLLAGGNPQIDKGYGDEPVRAYLTAIPDWKRPVAVWVDAVISRTLPDIRKAVKYNSPLYGAAGRTDWFMSIHCFTRYLKVAFFQGTKLKPQPPGESQQKTVRYLDIHEQDALDEQALASWVRQAAKLPGEKL